LRLGAPGCDQEFSLGFGLNTLGDDVDTELSRQPDHGLHRGRMTPVPRHAGNKFPRELEPIERQYGEIFERRIAGAEIVDRDFAPRR
jgi:hypothetical protein